MISRYSITLNNVSLASLDPSILVLDVKYNPRGTQDKTFEVAKRHGARFHDRKFGTVSVTIPFEIHEYDVADRQEVCANVVKWAKNGGVLEINDRPGQYLQCVCTSFPTVESARNWTDPLNITFTAYAIPFWQEETAVTKTLTGTSDSDALTVPGNVDDALVECEITAGASVSSFSLTVNGRTLTLSGLSLSSGDVVTISYDTDGIQSIKQGSTSLLNKRTGVDDLLANCGESNNLFISSSASITAVFSVRGLWL